MELVSKFGDGIEVYVVGSLEELIVSVRCVSSCVIEQPSMQ